MDLQPIYTKKELKKKNPLSYISEYRRQSTFSVFALIHVTYPLD